MDSKEDLIKMRDLFSDSAKILDELINLADRENNGEDVSDEYETAMGKFVVKMMKLQSLK
jgi:hypothetical protein